MIKRILPFALTALLGLSIVGCIKSKTEDTTPVTQPQGTFTGQFTRYRYITSTGKTDSSLKINLNLVLSGSHFKITGDTSVHAGSHGNFQYNSAYLNFVDSTISSTNTTPILQLPKIHLYGTYEYAYSSTKLQFRAYNDTLVYFYNFTKTN